MFYLKINKFQSVYTWKNAWITIKGTDIRLRSTLFEKSGASCRYGS